MSGGEEPRPDRVREAVRGLTLPLPAPPIGHAVRQLVDLFGFAPATVAKQIIEMAGSRLIGRMLDLRFGPSQAQLILTTLRLVRPPVGLLVGQLGDVEIEARHVRWPGGELARLRMEACNVHTQPGATTSLVVAPLRFQAWMSQSVVDGIIAGSTERVVVELTGDGVARARLPQHPHWGHVDLVPILEGRTLELRPRAVAVGRVDGAKRLVARLPPLRVVLPDGPAGSHLSHVEVRDRHLVVHGIVEEWREPLTPGQLDQAIRRIERFAGTVLQVPRSTPTGPGEAT